ncbi:AEL_HP2_G0025710.mRNA.1.CDS.1 [Saccharomyces cerevisiae]|nr:AEL_HP2_G0025710.mRNA.1.CDS.1 [Saccharomyces cerevisiae]CAI6459924.1 AEL_HP2_G0025710.mRNA.1.CDS.1 [Saccharomyces cerevisiae]
MYLSLEELLKISDVISLHCPLNNSTHHLINEDWMGVMKNGVIIINTSRGAVIDENALLQGIDCKKISSAGLDIFEYEPVVSQELLRKPNIIALPHMGTQAIQTIEEMEDCVVRNLYCGITTGKVETLIPEQVRLFD